MHILARMGRQGGGAPPRPRPGKACARGAAWGGWADPRRGHQRAQGGRGWADAVGGKGRLIFLIPGCYTYKLFNEIYP